MDAVTTPLDVARPKAAKDKSHGDSDDEAAAGAIQSSGAVPWSAPETRPGLIVRDLGRQPYEPVWRAMQRFTDARTDATPDELWLVEHDPVFTLGQAGKAEHVLLPGDVPVLQVDRGGQVTYHGPGQLVAYPLLDLKRLKIGVRDYVHRIEQAVIDVLAEFDIEAARRDGAPGVYVGDAKIAALGIRVRRGCSFHGLAFNIAVDLEPFSRINPCGYAGLRVTSLLDLGGPSGLDAVKPVLVARLARQFDLHTRQGGRPAIPDAEADHVAG